MLLPARMYGGGIRSLEDVAPAAFIGALCRAVPEFLDRRREDFSVQPGFLPMLAPVLGHGSFDEATRHHSRDPLRLEPSRPQPCSGIGQSCSRKSGPKDAAQVPGLLRDLWE